MDPKKTSIPDLFLSLCCSSWGTLASAFWHPKRHGTKLRRSRRRRLLPRRGGAGELELLAACERRSEHGKFSCRRLEKKGLPPKVKRMPAPGYIWKAGLPLPCFGQVVGQAWQLGLENERHVLGVGSDGHFDLLLGVPRSSGFGGENCHPPTSWWLAIRFLAFLAFLCA